MVAVHTIGSVAPGGSRDPSFRLNPIVEGRTKTAWTQNLLINYIIIYFMIASRWQTDQEVCGRSDIADGALHGSLERHDFRKIEEATLVQSTSSRNLASLGIFPASIYIILTKYFDSLFLLDGRSIMSL